MSSTEGYTGTTSLEFILNPFKFFFTDYVVHVTPSLEMRPRSPRIVSRRPRRCAPATLRVAHRAPFRQRIRLRFLLRAVRLPAIASPPLIFCTACGERGRRHG
ncbi:hypothetical protein D7S89_03410 [Trinickia fusca]|uniref:Uncharacterized protein n=1 Tax=Trinickia fusca TaxID=2419777 RepID=A0A494XWT2_9BURK|nr:hypothetical protein D7S89_03410 [Trinickia fusca]